MTTGNIVLQADRALGILRMLSYRRYAHWRISGAILKLSTWLKPAWLLAAILLGSTPALALPALTTTSIGTSSTTPSFGNPVTFTVTVTSGAGTPDGTVIFMADLVSLGSVALDPSGQATFTTSGLSIGVHAIAAVYVGNLNFLASASLSVNVNVTLAACTVNVSASAATVLVGASVNLTATVTSSGGTPGGTVTFRSGATVLGSGILNGSGQTSTVLNTSIAGALSIGADYGGDASHLPCSAPLIVIVVTIPGGGSTATATALTSSSNPALADQPLTLTAAVSASAGTPTGQITFKDGGQVIGLAQLSGGSAVLVVSSLTVGAHAMTAIYAGNATYAPSTSPVLTQSVSMSPDSTRLRNVQIVGTRIAAQNSGHAMAGTIDTAIDEGFAAGNELIRPSELGLRLTSARQDRKGIGPDWVVWSELRHTSLNPGGGRSNLGGNQTNSFAGITSRVTPDIIAGVFVGYESFGYSLTSLSGHLRGDGVTGGAYASWRFLPGLRFDVGAAQSEIAYGGASGLATAAFGGSRTFFTSGVAGAYALARGLMLEPSFRVFGVWETETAYTDSLGISQGQRSFFTGRASAGAKVNYNWLSPANLMVSPYFGAYADSYFNRDTATPASPSAVMDGTSTRLIGGVLLTTERGMKISTGGEVGGLGGGFTTWSFRTRGAVPF